MGLIKLRVLIKDEINAMLMDFGDAIKDFPEYKFYCELPCNPQDESIFYITSKEKRIDSLIYEILKRHIFSEETIVNLFNLYLQITGLSNIELFKSLTNLASYIDVRRFIRFLLIAIDKKEKKYWMTVLLIYKLENIDFETFLDETIMFLIRNRIQSPREYEKVLRLLFIFENNVHTEHIESAANCITSFHEIESAGIITNNDVRNILITIIVFLIKNTKDLKLRNKFLSELSITGSNLDLLVQHGFSSDDFVEHFGYNSQDIIYFSKSIYIVDKLLSKMIYNIVNNYKFIDKLYPVINDGITVVAEEFSLPSLFNRMSNETLVYLARKFLDNRTYYRFSFIRLCEKINKDSFNGNDLLKICEYSSIDKLFPVLAKCDLKTINSEIFITIFDTFFNDNYDFGEWDSSDVFFRDEYAKFYPIHEKRLQYLFEFFIKNVDDINVSFKHNFLLKMIIAHRHKIKNFQDMMDLLTSHPSYNHSEL